MDTGWLASDDGQAAIAAAGSLDARDPLRAAAQLRRLLPGLAAGQASDALTQAALRRTAAERYGIEEPLLLTRDGLEQATRPQVAAHRAALIAAAGARQVVDATAGLGFDTLGFLSAGLQVTAVERDPTTAAMLAANAPAAEVLVGDAMVLLPTLLPRLAAADVVFVDPARRAPGGPRNATTGRAQPERDPERWSPPWSAIASIGHPRIAVKAAPAFVPPRHWHAEWVSVHRTVVECAVYSWPVFAARRRATLLTPAGALVVAAGPSVRAAPSPDAAPSAGAWLHEPDPAVIRAGAIDALVEHGLRRIDAEGAWLTSDRPAPEAIAPAVSSYRVIAELTGSITEQRRLLDRLDVHGLTVKSRDAGIAPAVALRELRRPEGTGHVLVLARQHGRVGRWLAER